MYTLIETSDTGGVEIGDYERILQRWLTERYEEWRKGRDDSEDSKSKFAKQVKVAKANIIDGINGKRKVTNLVIIRVAKGVGISVSVALHQISQLAGEPIPSTRVAVRPEHEEITRRAIEESKGLEPKSKPSSKRPPPSLPKEPPKAPSRNS